MKSKWDIDNDKNKVLEISLGDELINLTPEILINKII